MNRCRITVLQRTMNRALALEYCADPELPLCPLFGEGQQFLVETSDPPPGFCDDGWNAIRTYVFAFLSGGRALYEGWMKDPNAMIACCNDAVRPVIFLIERVPDDAGEEARA